jgi:hypothetical protein
MDFNKKYFVVLAAAAAGAVIGAILYFGVGLNYRSIGVLTLESTLGEYKRFNDVLANKTAMAIFVRQSKASEAAKNELLELALTADPLRTSLTPVFRFSKADVKELGEAPRENAGEKPVLGARLSITNRDPKVAQESVNVLGAYVQQELLSYQLNENINQRVQLLTSDVPRFENEVINERFTITQIDEKIQGLKRIAATYPQTKDVETRQVITVDRGSERFLSPTTQLIAAEGEAMQSRQNLLKLERKLRQAALELGFLTKAQDVLRSGGTGSALAASLTSLANATLKEAASKEDYAKEVLNNTLMEIDSAKERFERQTRFISAPSLPVKPEPPGLLTYVLGGAMLLGLAAFSFLYRALLIRFLLGEPTQPAEK